MLRLPKILWTLPSMLITLSQLSLSVISCTLYDLGFTLFHIQISSSSTYQPPVWLTLFLCICSHSLELIASQRSFLWISYNFPEAP